MKHCQERNILISAVKWLQSDQHVKHTTPEPVEETESDENSENYEKSVNAIRGAEISIFISIKWVDEATNLQDSASDKEKSAAKKVAFLAKWLTFIWKL